MPSHDHMRQDELETAAPKKPTPEQGERGPLELAGQIGNSNMQRVAQSPALQRSPAAAGLIQRSPLARQENDEEAGGNENAAEAAPEAGGNENAAEAAPEGGGNENAAEPAPEGGGNENEAAGEAEEEAA